MSAPATARQVARRVLELVDDVAAAGDRTAAERAACEGLVESGRYRSAWVGVRTRDGEGVVVRASASLDDDGATGRTDAPPAAAEGEPTPWRRALSSGEVRVVEASRLGADRWPVPGAVPDRGSVAAVPVGGHCPTEAVLAVHTERSNAPGTLERSALGSLATTLGGTVDRLRQRALTVAGSAVELELRITDESSVLVRAAADHDCRLSLEGYRAEEDGWRLYCDIEGADPATVTEGIRGYPDVSSARPIVERTDGGRLEAVATDAPLPTGAAEAGATVRAAAADHGVCRATLDLPPSADVRGVVAHLREPFPDLQLLSRRGVDRTPTTPTVPDGAVEGMTDRQREALETAYREGYFQWPRTRTAEEIAPELGITSSTLHWHLRAAERQLLDAVFD